MSYRIIGYTADADTWCPTCATRNYGANLETATDDEGNEVYPIFDTDEVASYWVCHSCTEPIE